MQITVSELAALVGGQLASGVDGSAVVTNPASLAQAGTGDVTFCGSPKFITQLRNTKATVALVPKEFTEQINTICIHCENPMAAFALVLEKFAPAPVSYAPGIHETAVIGTNVILGEGVVVGPHAVIEEGAVIGDRSIIGAHAFIGHQAAIGEDCFFYPRVTIGARCLVGNRVIMHAGVVIGADGFGFEFKQGRHVKIPQTGIVQVDDDVEIGANSAIDRARFGRTWIQEGTKIDNLVQIGHNVIVGKHCIICGLVGIAGSVTLGDYVTLAGQAGLAGHLSVASQVTIGGQSGVNKTISQKGMYMGTPAVPADEYRAQLVYIHGIEKLRARVKVLEQELGEKMKTLPPGT